MSDEQQASAPPEIAEIPEIPETSPAADAYDQPLAPQREQELQNLLAAWNAPDANHGERRGPFDGDWLTGADVSWLVKQVRDQFGYVPDLHLEGADLSAAHVEGASLAYAHLEGASLAYAHLEGANLRGATLDGTTTLANAYILAPADTRPLLARLLRRPRYGPALGDLRWGDFDLVELTQLDGWEDLRRLADERGVTWFSLADAHRAALRAYRQVAQRLRDQGYSDIADRLADRAQVLQRKLLFRLMLEDWYEPWRLPGDLVRWFFSWFLALLAGYGYHPGRSVFWYLATIGCFAYLFFQATHGLITLGLPASKVQPLEWY